LRSRTTFSEEERVEETPLGRPSKKGKEGKSKKESEMSLAASGRPSRGNSREEERRGRTIRWVGKTLQPFQKGHKGKSNEESRRPGLGLKTKRWALYVCFSGVETVWPTTSGMKGGGCMVRASSCGGGGVERGGKMWGVQGTGGAGVLRCVGGGWGGVGGGSAVVVKTLLFF